MSEYDRDAIVHACFVTHCCIAGPIFTPALTHPTTRPPPTHTHTPHTYVLAKTRGAAAALRAIIRVCVCIHPLIRVYVYMRVCMYQVLAKTKDAAAALRAYAYTCIRVYARMHVSGAGQDERCSSSIACVERGAYVEESASGVQSPLRVARKGVLRT